VCQCYKKADKYEDPERQVPQSDYWKEEWWYDKIITGIKDYELLLPIPITALNSNPIITQNPGY
jgi:hypothetical protein